MRTGRAGGPTFYSAVMQPPEPGTSLDLEFADQPATADQAARPPATDLELPPSPAPPMPVEPAPVTVDPAARNGPLGNLVVAHFRRVEIAMLARVLITTLGGALPASMVRVEHRRSFGRRLTGRSGEPIGVSITAGERTLTFRAPEIGVAETTVGHIVRGVVLATSPVPMAQWLDELGVLLDEVTRTDEATRLALEQAFLR